MRRLWMLCLAAVATMCIVGVWVDTERRQSIYANLELLETDDAFPIKLQSSFIDIPPHVAPAVSRRILDALKQCDGRDIVTRLGTTPLMAGAWEGNTALVGECLRQKHETAVIDRFGQTALHFAVKSGQRQVVQMLVDAGADVVCLDDLGETPLTLAVRKDRPDLLAALASRPRSFSKVPELRYEFTDAWCGGVDEAIEANSGPDRLARNRAEIESRCETLRQAAALFPDFIDQRLIHRRSAEWGSSEKLQVRATLTALASSDPRENLTIPRWDASEGRPNRAHNAWLRELYGSAWLEKGCK